MAEKTEFVFEDLDMDKEETNQKVWKNEEIIGEPKTRAMALLAMIDVSGSMAGKKISSVNNAMREVVIQLREKESEHKTGKIQLAMMEFNNTAKWINMETVHVTEYTYDDIEHVSGGTHYGAAYKLLEEGLSSTTMLKDATDFFPVVLFISDGKPIYPYQEQLNKLKENAWFQQAQRVAVLIHVDDSVEDAAECRRILAEFAGSDEMVLEVNDVDKLKDMVVMATMNATMIQTHSGSQQKKKTGQDEFIF